MMKRVVGASGVPMSLPDHVASGLLASGYVTEIEQADAGQSGNHRRRR